MQHSEIYFRPARENDARIISGLRQRIWNTTYRGIYPDDLIDEFDYVWHIERDINRIQSDKYIVFLIVDGDIPIGYLILRKADPFILQSLYVLPEYQKKGIGRQAFSIIRTYCLDHGIHSFTCHCHPDNTAALGFYHAMGGTVTGSDEGNEERWQDSVILSFEV